MFNPSVTAVQSEPFIPVSGLPDWMQTMRRATRAHHCGQVVAAMAQYQQALALVCGLMPRTSDASSAFLSPVDAQVDACVCAFVSNHRCLAELQADEGDTDGAARTLAQAHRALLALVQTQPPASAWHRVAVWYSRDTHAALLSHGAEHGAQTDIAQALRAGCMAVRASGVSSTQVH